LLYLGAGRVVHVAALRGYTAPCSQWGGAWLGVCVQLVLQGAQLREQGGERCVVVALRIPVLLDCRKPFPPYKIKRRRHTAKALSVMVRLSLFTLWPLYEWNTLLVCWIAVRQMGHDGFLICVSRFAHASHTHTW
jgi:hypothetical protein